MHQMELAKRLASEIERQAASGKRLTLKIGELLPVDVPELLHLLEMLGHTGLRTRTLPSRVACQCGYKGKAEIYHRDHHATLFRCPTCHALPKVEKGEELELRVE